MSLICVNDLAGVGEECNQATPITVLSGLFLTTPDFEFANFTDFADQDKWLEGIRDGYIFPLQGIQEEEPQDVEDGVYEGSTGDKTFMYEGKRGSIYKFKMSLDAHKIMRGYSFKNWRLFELDRNNNIKGTSPDGTKATGFKLSYFRTKKQDKPTSENPPFTPVELQHANVKEYDQNGIYVSPSWLAADLYGVLQVTLVAGTITSNKFTVTVNYVDGSSKGSAGTAPSAAISGLGAANFKVVDQLGAVLDSATQYTATESSTTPGEYEIDATVGAMTSGTCQVIPSTTMLYKSAEETVSA